MRSQTLLLTVLGCAPAAFAAPAPQVAGGSPDPSSFGPDSQISYSSVPVPTGYPIVVDQNGYRSATDHDSYSGTPTTTGAVDGPTTLAASVPAGPPNPTATYYNSEGVPQNPFPAPYTPAGGLGTNGSLPRYMVNSDFDFESITLGLYQEWIELDLFHDGLARFSDEDFAVAGLGPEARSLIEFMADQETGHATLLTNMLGNAAPKQCYYNYPYNTGMFPHRRRSSAARTTDPVTSSARMARLHAARDPLRRVRRVGVHQSPRLS